MSKAATRDGAEGTSAARRAAPIVVTVALLEALAVAGIFLFERIHLRLTMFDSSYREGPTSDRYIVRAKGIRQPPARPTEEAGLSDEEEILGVVVGGASRAYRLASMRGSAQHIVNDVIAGIPLSVTYCDITECVRAFTGPGTAPLALDQGGLMHDRMVLSVGGVDFLQDSGEPIEPGAGVAFPYATYPCTRTTWKAWREAHPQTDAWAGTPPPD
jgi:hypothetical protein